MPARRFSMGKHIIKDNSPSRLARHHRHPHLRPHRLAALLFVLLASFLLLRNDFNRVYYRPVRNRRTSFSSAASSLRPLELPPSPLRVAHGPSSQPQFDDRYRFVGELGKGCEGYTQVYEDVAAHRPVVIKTWFKGGRNEVPDEFGSAFEGQPSKWPTEIEATLRLAGMHVDGVDEQFYDSVGLLPALDYFVVASANTDDAVPAHWHLVTPYISAGTLEHLAKALRRTGPKTNIQDLDRIFRPSFDRVLAVVGDLHARGYCHDDIKPDNIFVVNETGWILSDLGNVREIAHPYHDTADWSGKGQWADCRANDLRRLLSSYLTFLRLAVGDSRDANNNNDTAVGIDSPVFDVEFLRRHQAWSRMYWDFVSHPVASAEALSDASAHSWRPDDAGAGGAMAPAEGSRPRTASSYRSRMLGIAVSRELACVWITRPWHRLWPSSWWWT